MKRKLLKNLAITAVIVFPFVLIYYFLILPNQKTIENVYDEIYFSSMSPWEKVEGVKVYTSRFYDYDMNETDLYRKTIIFPKSEEKQYQNLGIYKSYSNDRTPYLDIAVSISLDDKTSYVYSIYYYPYKKNMTVKKFLRFMDRSDPDVENPDDITKELKSFNTTQAELDKKAQSIIEENVYQNWFKHCDSRFSMSDFGKYRTV